MTRIWMIGLAMALGSATTVADTKTAADGKPPVKKERRTKKVAICEKCGKPESKCECHDEKHEKEHEQKKEDAAAAKQP